MIYRVIQNSDPPSPAPIGRLHIKRMIAWWNATYLTIIYSRWSLESHNPALKSRSAEKCLIIIFDVIDSAFPKWLLVFEKERPLYRFHLCVKRFKRLNAVQKKTKTANNFIILNMAAVAGAKSVVKHKKGKRNRSCCCMELLRSYPKRLKAVKKAVGGATEYWKTRKCYYLLFFYWLNMIFRK